MQYIDASDDDVPSNGAKDVEVEVGQLDHDAMFLNMPVSQGAGSQKNDRGVDLRVVEELRAEYKNFDRKKAIDAIPIFLNKSLSLDAFLSGIAEFHRLEKVKNSDKPNDNDVMVQNMQDLEEDVGLGRRKSSFGKDTVVTQMGDYCGTILRHDSPILFIDEMGAEDDNFDREKAKKAIPVFLDDGLQDFSLGNMDFGLGLGRRKSSVEFYDTDPNGNDITVENIKQLQDGVQGRRHRRSVRNMFKKSRAVEDPRKHRLKIKKEDLLVSDSPSLVNPNPRKKKSRCAIL